MILFPAKLKFKKYHKAKYKFLGVDYKYNFPRVGVFGLKILSSKRITSQQIESVRQVIRRKIKTKTTEHLKISVFPDLPVTKKSSGLRMGKGKGNFEFWAVPILQGRVVFELSGNLNKFSAFKALLSGGKKLPGIIKIVSNLI
jgi:large subunit ribosomal protein L16